MEILQALLLGIIQGITEWLPVSSSGHLVLFQNFMRLQPPVLFDIILHLGSLLVVFFVFYKDILNLIKGVLNLKKKSLMYALFLIIATIPIGLVGVFLNDFIKSIFHSNTTVGISLLATSVLLFLTKDRGGKHKPGFKNTFLMGISQAFAILPGVSRSGATISIGLLAGIKKEEAARFSFLMFIPAILGASVFELSDISAIGSISSLVIGFVTTVIVGYFSLKLLLNIIKKNRFHLFGWYCLAVGIVVLVL